MAVTKEAMVIILDIGKNSQQKDDAETRPFFDKEKSCCMKILQRKMFSSKKDEIGIVFMGSKETENELNRTMEGYDHICEAIPIDIPNWDTLRCIEMNMKYEGSVGDWLDALIVAMDMLRRASSSKKFGNFKIVLFTTFSTYVNDDNVSVVIQGLKSMDIELVVISDNIKIIEDSSDGCSQCVFSQKPNKSEHQKHSEKLAHKVVEESNGNLCNFDYAIHHLMNFQRKKTRPSFWYATLEIGSKISIQIASTIAIKEEQHFKWSTESSNENMSCFKAIEYFNNGEKIDPQAEDLIKGYMLGSTPIAYDESLGITAQPTIKGLKCMAFTHKSNILQDYLCGSGTAIVVPKKDQSASEKLFFALVESMVKSELVMIGRRVYASGYKPKLVVLIPNLEREIPCLSMFELFYAEQYFYWYFPLLKTKKTEPTAEQYEAVDKFIDSMDLMKAVDEESGSREAFPHKHLLNLSLQYIYETITTRALNPKQPVPVLDDRLAEALQIPHKIHEDSIETVKKLKEIFPLEEVKKPGKQQLIRRLGAISSEPDENLINPDNIPEAMETDGKTIVEVGTVTPSEDFTLLIQRGEDFNTIVPQIINVINDLVFKSMTEQNDKIGRAMMTFREEAIFTGPWAYNDWIKEFKETVLLRKKFDFWQDVVVKEQLGIIPTSQSDLVYTISDEEAAEFLKISTDKASEGPQARETESVDDLFDAM